jgi:hypothetical protein
MLFKNEMSNLQLMISNYEFSKEECVEGSDDLNWLVMRGSYTRDGQLLSDSVSCLLTKELRDMTAALKKLLSGEIDRYQSEFIESYFEMVAFTLEDDKFSMNVAFELPRYYDTEGASIIKTVMTRQELQELVDELGVLCKKYRDRN